MDPDNSKGVGGDAQNHRGQQDKDTDVEQESGKAKKRPKKEKNTKVCFSPLVSFLTLLQGRKKQAVLNTGDTTTLPEENTGSDSKIPIQVDDDEEEDEEEDGTTEYYYYCAY